MSSDQTSKSGAFPVGQKVRQSLSGILHNTQTLFYVAGLAAFYAWNLIDIFEPSFLGGLSDSLALTTSTVVSSLCNVAGYIFIALLLSRRRAYYVMATVAASVAALAIAASWLLSVFSGVETAVPRLICKGIVRLCSACVIVAWGMRFSSLDRMALTQRVLAAFAVAALTYLFVAATSGAVRCLLFASLLPLSMLFCLRVGSSSSVEGRITEDSRRVRGFISQVWRLLLVFALFGMVAWVMILEAQTSVNAAANMGTLVAAASFAVVAALLVVSHLFEGVLSSRYVFKLVLPLVMVGMLLMVAFEGFRGTGAAIASVGFTCFDLFCFVAVADACRKAGVRPGAAFGWYRALESFMPLPALAAFSVLRATSLANGDIALYALVVACSLVLAMTLVFDRGNIMKKGSLNPDIAYPRAEALYFARQCEEAIKLYGISPREAEVLSLVVRGRSVPHIAERLHLSRGTVKTHITRIYQKFGAGDRQEMIDLIESVQLEHDLDVSLPS